MDVTITVGNERSQAQALVAVAGQLSGPENAVTLGKALDAAIAIGDEESRAKAIFALAKQFSGPEGSGALGKAMAAVVAIGEEGVRGKSLAKLLAYLDQTSSLQQVRNCLHWSENSTRAHFLEYCNLLPKLSLRTATFECIAESIIDICSNWKWL